MNGIENENVLEKASTNSADLADNIINHLNVSIDFANSLNEDELSKILNKLVKDTKKFI